ncbi:hypothetical protein C7S18_08280 [Ahniella affigens]|uniref:ORC1/DEAH AAA+ ATPase domain-containing protein n=1 Tax=Ahniella affigens TaxID=2021234 RepID=A0A2P1PQT6_9GAMM|nr:AAA family ATPase [Ahniella affigens]AVP97191.1 hypothetical protein C7S18_08280 [Ahniella affigens]
MNWQSLLELERWSAPRNGQYWALLEQLANVLSDVFLDVSEPLEDLDGMVELATGDMGGHRYVLLGNADGQILVISVGDTIQIQSRHSLQEFDSSKDEIKNILVDSRRYSRERDVYICTRRWEGSKAPEHRYWRASFWHADDRFYLNPIQEMDLDRRDAWVPVPAPGDETKRPPRACFDVPIQNARDDDLSLPDIDIGDALLAAGISGVARYATGRLSWDKENLAFGPEPPKAMALDRNGEALVVASAQGQLCVYRKNQPARVHALDAGVAVLGCWQYEQQLEVVLACRDGSLRHLREVPEARLRQLWNQQVESALDDFKTGEDWRCWLQDDSEPEVPKLKSLLWLHASFLHPHLLMELEQFLRQPSQDRPGTRFGQELARLLQEDPNRADHVLKLYQSAGLAVREQLDRMRPSSSEDLANRLLRNAWEAAEDSNVGYSQAAAIGNLTTRPFLHEATWRGVASSVAGVHDGAQQRWLLATSCGLLCLESLSGTIPTKEQRRNKLPAAAIRPRSVGEEAPFKAPHWLRGLNTLSNAALIGHESGVSLLDLQPDGSWVTLDWAPDHGDAQALYGFAEAAAQHLDCRRVWLAWQTGIEVLLDCWELTGKGPQHCGRFPLRVPAMTLALLPDSEGQQLVAATRTRELHWMRLREDAFYSQSSQRLDSNAVTLQFAIGAVNGQDQPVLLVGTEAGWVYCFDALKRRVLWTYRAGTSVQSLNCIGAGTALLVGVCSTPHWLTLLDVQGRRSWRHHVGRRPSDLFLMADHEGTLERIGVLHEGGCFSLYRRSDRERYQHRASQLMPTHKELQPGDRLLVGLALAHGDLSVVRASEVKRAEARRLLLAQAASCKHLELSEYFALPLIRCADVAAMARELHPNRTDADVDLLWRQALDLLEDYPKSRQGEMLAEIYALRRRRGQDLNAIEHSFEELSQRFEFKTIEALFLKAADAALQAAQAWWNALPDIDTGFKRLHHLPLAVARQLRILIPASDPLLPALNLLTEAAQHLEKGPAPNLSLGRQIRNSNAERWTRKLPRIDAAQDKTHPYLRTMAAARELQPEQWADVVALLTASAQSPVGNGPLPAALRAPGICQRGPIPEDSVPLAQQEAWITLQLGQRWQLPRDVERGWPAWAVAIESLLRVTEDLYREGLNIQLGRLVARARLRLKARVLRWTGWQLRLELEFIHDGKFVLENPELQLQWYLPGLEDQANSLVLDFAPTRVAPSDPPWRCRLDLTPPRDTRQLFLRLHCFLNGKLIDVSVWQVALDEVAGHVDTDQRSPLLSPPFDLMLLRRIRDATPGAHLLVLDDVLQPKAVLAWLSEQTGAQSFALDAATAKLGPDRLYPKMLDLDAVLRAIEGLDPLDFEQRYSADHVPLASAQGLMLLNFCGLAERLQQPVLQPLRAQILAWLRRIATSKPSARWMIVLPSPLAQQWHVELLKAGIDLIHPAQLHIKTWTDEDWRALSQARLCTPSEARQQVATAGEDLRLLGAGTRLDDLRLYWARAEVAALRPAELLALVALAEAKVRLRLNEIPSGAIAAELVQTEARKHQPKTLATVGEVMGDQRRLRRLQNVSRDLLVFGMDPEQDLDALNAEARALLQLSGFNSNMLNRLAKMGLLHQVGGLHLLRPDLAQLLQHLRAQGKSLRDCAQALGDEDAWWQGIDLSAVAHVRAEDWSQWQPGASASLKLAHASGRIWLGNTETAILVSWIESLTGAALNHPVTDGYALLEQQGLPNSAGIAVSLQRETKQSEKVTIAGRLWLEVRIGPNTLRQTRLPVIDTDHLRSILRSGNPRRAFWASLRSQLNLQLLSPFVHVGAMPPDSPLFVGRRHIREEVAAHLTRRSFLILGSRQAGKTSLLNQLWFEASRRSDVLPALIDSQGRNHPEQLLEPLNRELARFNLTPAPTTDQALDAFVRAAAEMGRMPVLLINEIDGLLQDSPEFLQQLRGRHEHSEMRFIFVGYAPVLWALQAIHGPMYHFTSGTGGHFLLGPLQREESRQLLGWLIKPPLDLEWLDQRHQEAGETLLLEAGYDTPWLLQDLCQALVTQLVARGSGVITLDDVRRMLDQHPPLLNKLESAELRKVLGDSRANEIRETGVWWILLALVNSHYPSDSNWRRLMLMQAPEFTPEDARASCLQVIESLPLTEEERSQLRQWLDRVDFRELLSALTLTMIISAGRRLDAQPYFCFAQNLYPIELLRASSKNRTLEDLLLERTNNLLTQIDKGKIRP